MLLIRHSDRASNAVRAASPGGELFDNYAGSFNQVLSRSRAVWPED